MKKSFYIFAAVLLFAHAAYAEECIVTNNGAGASVEGTLANILQKIRTSGACLADDLSYRNRYSNYIKKEGPFHVVTFDKSMEVRTGGITLAAWSGGRAIVIRGGSGAHVAISGTGSASDSGIVLGGGAPVVIDNIKIQNFGGSAVTMESDNNLLMDVEAENSAAGINVFGKENVIADSKITGNKGDGITIGNKGECGSVNYESGRGDGTAVYGTIVMNNGGGRIRERDGYGIYVNADRVVIGGGEMGVKSSGNKLEGVYVESSSKYCGGREGGNIPREVIVTRTIGGPFSIAGAGIPSPKGVADISLAGDAVRKIVGTFEYGIDPVWIINPNAVVIDIYETGANGTLTKYLGSVDGVSADSGGFVLNVSKSGDSAPVAAVALDMENWQTSMPSVIPAPSDSVTAPTSSDSDGDGLDNSREGEEGTDPINPDSDYDGLTDGEEVLGAGIISELEKRGTYLSDPTKLDPLNPDSDNDCLPDGLEAGVDIERLTNIRRDVAKPVRLALSSSCDTLVKDNKIFDFDNAIWINDIETHSLDNVAALYDTDTASLTDPTLADTDGDGIPDGKEDFNLNGKRDEAESDPSNRDSDGDEIIDGDEGDINGNGQLDDFESSPVKADSDNDGVIDSVEIRRGMLPGSCDSDGDSLPDGIESGVIHPNKDDPSCRGLQNAGTNFSKIDLLDPTSADSDGDGIEDGEEDKNANGWIDAGESDPTLADSDGDGIDDYVENTGDVDRDGIIDIDPYTIENGSECFPPAAFSDADCDGIINAVDPDSDNDGCMDREESMESDSNMNGVPDPYDSKSALCGAPVPGTGGGAQMPSSGASPAVSAIEVNTDILKGQANLGKGGGSCSLIRGSNGAEGALFTKCLMKIIIMMIFPIFLATFLRRVR